MWMRTITRNYKIQTSNISCVASVSRSLYWKSVIKKYYSFQTTKRNNNRNDNEDVLRIMIYQKWIIKNKKHFNLNINYFINQLFDEFEYQTYMQRKYKNMDDEIEKSLYESYGLDSEEWKKYFNKNNNINININNNNSSSSNSWW